ncbi:MAG: hypothetical protein AAGK05_18870, partial [Pseudomonadota bacterium]
IPGTLMFVAQIPSIAFTTVPHLFCGENDYVYIAITSTIVSISLLYMALYASQIINIFGLFLSNFFDILSQFLRFLMIYFIIILVFARIFENVTVLKMRNDNGTSITLASDRSLFNGFIETMYTTFRLSLNIVDFSRMSTDGITMVVHLAFVLVLPFMFFNYIIGVVSAQLSYMIEVRAERIFLHRILLSIWGKLMFEPFNRLLSLCGSANLKTDVTVTVCLPVTGDCINEKTRGDIMNNISVENDW